MNLDITLSDSALKTGDLATVTFSFSEAVAGFGLEDMMADNATLGNLATSDNLTWTATLTPNAAVTAHSNVVTVDYAGFTDLAGNAGSSMAQSNNYEIDNVPPTVSIALDRGTLNANQTATATFTFSEAVTGFTASDVTAQNGALSNLATADDGVTWTATYTPNNVRDTSNVLTLTSGSVSDAAGNLNAGATSSANFIVDAVRPTASVVVDNIFICTVPGYTDSLVTITFSEAVSGLGIEDLATPNGTLSNLATSDNITWTATLTPIAGRTDSSNVITLDKSGVTNAAGSAGAGVATSNNYEVDVVTPTATVEVDNTNLRIGGSAQVKMTFSEPIVFADINHALSADNGTISNFTNNDGGITWYATLTPTAGVTSATNKVVLNLADLMDFSSNSGVGYIESNNYAVDTVAPTATVVLGSSALLAGQSTTVTITFSEAVGGFDNTDLNVDNGTLSNVATGDGGVTWTATYTPAADIANATNAVALAASSYTDTAGNTGGGAASANYTVQTVRPAATIVVADTVLKAGEASTVTITFSEAVSGFGSEDLTATGGTLSNLTTSDNITWTATLTADASVTDSSNLVTLDNTGLANAAGNAGSGTTDSNNYAVDTVAPTVAVTLADNTLTSGQSSLVTFAFSEAVSGFDNADITVAGGTLSAVATSDGGVTWTATFTAASTVNSASVVVTVVKAGITDTAGNAGAGSTSNSTTPLPDDTPPGSVTTIDGVQVQTQVVRDPVTGLDNVVVNVPLITAVSDGPHSAHPGLADIPLTVGAGAGAVDLLVSLPVGTGIQSSGANLLLNDTQARQDLLQRIHSTGSPDSGAMSTAAQGFLDALADGTPVAVKTLVLTIAPGATPGQPIIISGGAAGGSVVGLIIDATQLPAGTVIQLDNVDFAAVTGPVTLRGGLGQNVVVGDNSAQNILLGPDDDVLFGGGGNDIVGSAGGNDRIDGGTGNDIVFGGIGNDTLAGGAGDDVVQGGRSDAGQWTFYLNAQGQVGAQHQTLLADAKATEALASAELDHSVAALAFTGASAAMLQGLATLYAAAFGRTADLGGVNFWLQSGASLAKVAHGFATSAEFTKGAGALGNAGLVHALYDNALGTAGAAAAAAEQTAWIAKLDAAGDPAAARAELLLSLSQDSATAAHWTTANGIVITGTTLATEQGWIGGSGNDVLEGGAGNDRLVGGDGIDTVVYAGKLADYRIVLDAQGEITIHEARTGGDIDTLVSIEKGQFGDGTVDLGFTQSGGASLQQIGMLYQTVLDRAADLGGMVFWNAHNMGAAALAQQFVGSREFQARFGALDNAAFATLMETNALNHAPDAASVQSWTAYLDTHSRAEMVTALIGSPDVVAAQFAGTGLVLV
ncbi:Ig-like domain-containing protein [Duganella sp. CT11-25]|uniref:Ig-like domain-containing protein n=1 Tax=unclassified Duganella TaxID=2636909 RepID=UPI0039B03FD6